MSARKPVIILIEDNPSIRRVLRTELASHGFEVHEVDTGDSGMTAVENRKLTALVRNTGKVMAHRQLLKEVWGPSHVEHYHYLRNYMANLRNKLEGDSARPRLLLTEACVGYRLATSEVLVS